MNAFRKIENLNNTKLETREYPASWKKQALNNKCLYSPYINNVYLFEYKINFKKKTLSFCNIFVANCT